MIVVVLARTGVQVLLSLIWVLKTALNCGRFTVHVFSIRRSNEQSQKCQKSQS